MVTKKEIRKNDNPRLLHKKEKKASNNRLMRREENA